ncbi:hypothetical protein ACEWY4_007889 [Coilia grayii]|uniref:PARP catalytic domain-containing protein n=1 Tax=Coilia grayii TaxID=363190 RepID=A0ABD1K9B5_9TELE
MVSLGVKAFLLITVLSLIITGSEPQRPRCKTAGHHAYKNNGVYIMYHGTSRQAAASIMQTGFRQSADGMLGRGVYVTRDLQKASRYPLNLPPYLRCVLVVRVKVGKVKKITYQGHPLQKTWHSHGYDTAWVPPNCGMVPSGMEENCVWDPKRIKIIQVIYPGMG